MKKVFITDFDKEKYTARDLFPLVRPFLEPETNKWKIDEEILLKKNLGGLNLEISSSIQKADFVLVSEPLNYQHDRIAYAKLAEINRICVEKNIFAYVYISGDYGKRHPQFSNIIYYRMGGFKSQLDKNNKAFFFLLSNQLDKIFNRQDIFLREKSEKPTVGFCGHSTNSLLKSVYEKSKLVEINLKRILSHDFCFEPLFSSAFERFRILKSISNAKDINTNFIFREKYRAGAVTDEERHKTTMEYYNNIIESDYVVCLRGSGNFSVRFFETLMMGRIPVFVNTDCLLPLEDEIDWKNQVVWVEWKDRKRVAEIILNFHKRLTKQQFLQLQNDNRAIWVSQFNLKYYLKKIITS